MTPSSAACSHSRTAIQTTAKIRAFDDLNFIEEQDHLVCMDCGAHVEFDPTICVPDSFLYHLRAGFQHPKHFKKKIIKHPTL